MKRAAILLLTILILFSPVGAGSRDQMNFQGILRDSSGNLINDSTHDFRLEIYDDPAAGSQLWTEDQLNVTITDGVFNIELGEVTPLDPADFTGDVFLQVTIGTDDVFGDGETLAPRQQILSAAYALNAHTLDGSDSTAFMAAGTDNWVNTTGDAMTGDLTMTDNTDQLAFGHTTDAYLITVDNVTNSGIYFSAAANNYWEWRGAGTQRGRIDLDNGNMQIDGSLDVDNTGNNAGNFAGDLRVGSSAANDDDYVYFDTTTTEWLRWDDVPGQFEFSDDLLVSGNLSATGSLTVGGTTDPYVNETGDTMTGDLTLSSGADLIILDNTGSVIDFSESVGNKIALWGSPAGSHYGLGIQGSTLQLYTDLSSNLIAFGYGSSGAFTETARIGGDGNLRIGQNSAADDDWIYFDTTTTEWFGWDNSETSFEVSDDLGVSGVLQTGTGAVTVGYNRMGTGTSTSGDMSNTGDLFVSNDIETPTLYATTILDRTTAASAAAGAVTMTLEADGIMRFMMDDDNDCFVFGEAFEWYANGSYTLANKLMDLGSPGSGVNLRLNGTVLSNQWDLAEAFIRGEPMEPGDLVRVDPGRTNRVLVAAGEGDATAIGVVSEKPGMILGGTVFSLEALARWGDDLVEEFLAVEPAYHAKHGEAHPLLVQDPQSMRSHALGVFTQERLVAVALSGRVPVKVDTRFGAIRAGDLLAPSPIPGVAMKATRPGPVIGTAMEDFAGEAGKVMTFIHRGSYTPDVERPIADLKTDMEQLDARTPAPETGIQVLDGNLQVVLDRDANDASRFSVFRDGGQGLRQEVFRVDEAGNVYTKGALRPAALDLAEYHRVSEPVEVGDVLVIDPRQRKTFRRCNVAADGKVMGIVSGAPGVLLGSGLERIAAEEPDLAARIDEARRLGDRDLEQEAWDALRRRFERSHAAIALSGTVPCKVDAAYGPIEPGDLLVASPTPGHAMRAHDPAPGTIIGKALEGLDHGEGLIDVVVMLR